MSWQQGRDDLAVGETGGFFLANPK